MVSGARRSTLPGLEEAIRRAEPNLREQYREPVTLRVRKLALVDAISVLARVREMGMVAEVRVAISGIALATGRFDVLELELDRLMRELWLRPNRDWAAIYQKDEDAPGTTNDAGGVAHPGWARFVSQEPTWREYAGIWWEGRPWRRL